MAYPSRPEAAPALARRISGTFAGSRHSRAREHDALLVPMDRSEPRAVHNSDFTRHRGDIARYLVWLGVPEPFVDELTQDVFLVAHRRRDDFRGGSSAKTWLTGIAFHLVLNWRRHRKRRRAYEVATELAPVESEDNLVTADVTTPDALDELLAKELCTRVSRILDEQSELARRLWLMVVLEEVGIRRAASVLGVTEYQAQQVYGKTLERVRHAVGENGRLPRSNSLSARCNA